MQQEFVSTGALPLVNQQGLIRKGSWTFPKESAKVGDGESPHECNFFGTPCSANSMHGKRTTQTCFRFCGF
jgi:hypothetical protein